MTSEQLHFRRRIATLMFAITGLFFSVASAAQDIPVVRFTVTEFVIEGESPLRTDDMQETLAPYLGDHEGLEGLLAAADALEAQLKEAGYAFLRVAVPQQTMTEGIVRLSVFQFKVNEVVVRGNKYFQSGNVTRSLPALQTGKTPNTKQLSRQLVLANEHPSKNIEVKFRQSKKIRSVDADIDVTDRRPWSLFTAVNNTGTDDTDDSRVTFGALHSNLFDRDHTATITYTTSPREPGKVKQWGLSYRVPFYGLGGVLNGSFVKSDVNTGRVAEVFDVSGAGRFWNVGYTHRFHAIGRLRHTLTIRVEDKFFDNNVAFSGLPIGIDVRSRPLTIRYDATYPFRNGSVRGYAGYARNLGGGSQNDDVTYAAARAGAEQDWSAIRLGGGFTHALPSSWALVGRADGQIGTEPLIAGEQFGVGGATSVRGYDEREVTGDTGYAASLELWSPPVMFDTRFLIFGDVGYRKVQNPQPGEGEDSNLASIGIGGRWSYKRSFSAQADIARAFRRAGGTGAGHTKLHFTLLYRF